MRLIRIIRIIRIIHRLRFIFGPLSYPFAEPVPTNVVAGTCEHVGMLKPHDLDVVCGATIS